MKRPTSQKHAPPAAEASPAKAPLNEVPEGPPTALPSALRQVAAWLLPRAALALAGALVFTYLFSYNGSPSRDIGYYFTPPAFSGLQRGDGVLACPPPSGAGLGLRRGYLTEQSVRGCPPGARPLNKKIAATSGDTVRLSPRGLFVNGRRTGAAPPTTDREGRPLPPRYGTHVLGAGTYWLAADLACSYDSRYFGPVSTRQIRARALPIWTVSPSTKGLCAS